MLVLCPVAYYNGKDNINLSYLFLILDFHYNRWTESYLSENIFSWKSCVTT